MNGCQLLSVSRNDIHERKESLSGMQVSAYILSPRASYQQEFRVQRQESGE